MGLFVVPAERADELVHTELILVARVLCYGSPAALRSAYLHGCDDYLKDPWKLEELAFRAERLLPAGPAVFAWGGLEVDAVEARLLPDDGAGPRTVALSRPESVILAALASRPNSPVPRAGLFYLLWGTTAEGSRAVDVHVGHLRRKLRSACGEGASGPRIETVHGIGYLLR